MRHTQSILARFAVLGTLLLAGGGCAPALGDGCDTSVDCSVNGDRVCDLAQPGGYCTIVDCSPGACGDEGYCIRFRPEEPRLSRDYCMYKCDNRRDCRDAYECVSAGDLNPKDGAEGEDVAENLDKRTGKFCAVRQ